MRQLILALGLYLFLLPLSLAQDSMTKEEVIDFVITDFRDKVLNRILRDFKAYEAISKEVKESGFSISKKEAILSIASRIPRSRKEKYFYEKLERVLFKRKYEGELLKRFKNLETEFVAVNKNFHELTSLRVLSKNYEVDSTGQQNLVKEIVFYNLDNGQRIAEVGAGWGEFSFMVSRIFKFESLYINELKKSLIVRIEERLKKDGYDRAIIKTIKGSKKSIKLRGKDLDRIIIRNSYHHFSNKDKMVKSIKASLNENGKLYLSEPITELEEDGYNRECPDAISKKEVLLDLNNNGFVLKRELVVGNFLLMEFELRK